MPAGYEVKQIAEPSSRPRDLRRNPNQPRHNPRGRPFPPGNPGRLPGSRNKITALLERVFEEEGEELVRAVVAHAKAGNPTALRFCAWHLPHRSRTAPFELPPIKTSHDAVAAMRQVSALIASGGLEPAQGVALTKVLDRQFGMLRSEELTARRAAKPAPRPLSRLSDADLTARLLAQGAAQRTPPRQAAAKRHNAERPPSHPPEKTHAPETPPPSHTAPAPTPASESPPAPLLELPPSWMKSGDGLQRAARMLGLNDLGGLTVMPNPQLVAPRLVRPPAGGGA